ncbi:MAG: translocation/assembly module TamB domain-containing protein, partial [Candidatus Eiseniibacteriota bacterium]
SDIVLSLHDIRGNPLAGFEVESPSVRFRDGHQPPLLEARNLRVAYSLWGLMAGTQRSIDVVIERPVVRLSRDREGHLRLPRWESHGGGGASEPVRLHLRLHEAEVVMPDTALSAHRVEFDAVGLSRPARVDVSNLSWERGPYGTRLDAMRAHAEFGDSVRLRISELRSPEVRLTASSAWRASGGPRHVVADVEEIHWPLLARVFDNQTLNVPGSGSIHLDAVGDQQWRGSFGATLDWNHLPGTGGGEFRFGGGQLAVEPLRFDSPAGNLRGRLQWAHKGWELAGQVADGNPERWQAIKLNGWPKGALNGWFRYGEDTRPRGSAELEARLGGSVLGGWRADSAWVNIAFPDAAPDSFTVRMLRRGGRMGLHGRTTHAGWAGSFELSRYPLDEWEDGRRSGLSGLLVAGSGTVDNRDQGLFVNADLSGERSSWIGIQADRLRLPSLHGRLLPTPDLDTPLRLTDAMYLGVHFDSVRSAIHFGDQKVEIDSVRAWAGDTLVTTAGRSLFDEQGWRLTLDRAEAASGDFHWLADAPIEMHGDSHQVWFDQLAAHDGEAHLAVSGRWAGPGGRYDWNATARSLDLARLGLPDEWGLSGRADVTLDVDGDSGAPGWHVLASANSPGTRGHLADSLALEMSGSRARLEVARFGFALGAGRFVMHGTAEGMTRDWPDSLTGTALLRWVSSAHAWHGDARASALSLDRLAVLAPVAEGVSGVLDATVAFRGRPGDPQVDAEATLKPVAFRVYSADQLGLRASFANRQLEVKDLRISRGGLDSRIQGRMPVELALGRPILVPDEAMHWTIAAPNGDLSLAPQFVPQIGYAEGHFDVEATLDGTTRHPVIQGTARLREGRLRLAAREEILEGLAATFHIQSTGVVLDSLTARQGTHGRVRASGRVNLDGFALAGYSFNLTLRDCAASESGTYAALFDGDFVVTNGPRLHGETLPMVAGEVRLKRAAILFDFTNQSEMQRIAAATQPLFWTYRIQLEAPSGMHWQPPDGDIELNADLRMEQTRDSLLIFGEMHAVHGTYWFLSNKFTVNTVDLTFDNVQGVDPQIDALATTRVVPTQESVASATSGTATDPATQDLSAHEITAHIHGRANQPLIDFSDSDLKNPWDQERILREITYGRFVGANNRVTAGDPLDNYMTRAINRSLSTDLSQAFGGYINEWSLERDRGGLFSGEGEVVMSATSQVTNQLSLGYSQRLPGLSRDVLTPLSPSAPSDLFERQVRAEFRLNRFFFVTTDISQRRTTGSTSGAVSSGPDYNVNLKARWEY